MGVLVVLDDQRERQRRPRECAPSDRFVVEGGLEVFECQGVVQDRDVVRLGWCAERLWKPEQGTTGDQAAASDQTLPQKCRAGVICRLEYRLADGSVGVERLKGEQFGHQLTPPTSSWPRVAVFGIDGMPLNKPLETFQRMRRRGGEWAGVRQRRPASV